MWQILQAIDQVAELALETAAQAQDQATGLAQDSRRQQRVAERRAKRTR